MHLAAAGRHDMSACSGYQDSTGQVTSIQYNDTLTPPTVVIIAPHGQQTTITLNGSGYASAISRTNGVSLETWSMTYQPNQPSLLQTLTDPNSGVHTFGFSLSGLLTSDKNPLQNVNGNSGTVLSRMGEGGTRQVSITTGEGHTSVYQTGPMSLTTASGTSDVITTPSGTKTQRDHRTDDTWSSTVNGNDGSQGNPGTLESTTIDTMAADPCYGPAATFDTSSTSALYGVMADGSSGNYSVGVSRTVDTGLTTCLSDPTHLPVQRTEYLTVTGRKAISTVVVNNASAATDLTTYAGLTRTITTITPAGRVTQSVVDGRGRVKTITRCGFSSNPAAPYTTCPAVPQGDTALATRTFDYDDANLRYSRLLDITDTSSTDPTRQTVFGYYTPTDTGFVQSVQDPSGLQTQFGRDSVGRVTSTTIAGVPVIVHYDGNGNAIRVTPPGQPDHVLGYNGVDLLGSYTPPSASAVTWSYDNDLMLRSMARPDGTLSVTPDFYGRPSRISFGDSGGGSHTVSLTYDEAERIKTTSVDGISTTASYVGGLVTKTAWSGPSFAGSVGATYDVNSYLGLLTNTIDTATITYAHDADGLITGTSVSGPSPLPNTSFSIPREASTGLLKSGGVIGAISDTWS